MSKQLIAVLSFLCITALMQVKAQSSGSGTVSGVLLDTASKQSLSAATVSLLNRNDSSLVSYVISDTKGNFRFDKVAPGDYLIQVAFQGYGIYQRPITVRADNPTTSMGNVYLKALENTLETVVVKSSPPIVVKKDTVEFNAGSFKTKPNATAEDLLQKLPGVTVDKNGGITAQGESVARILVNGKRFFSDDPKLATKNLPPDVIDKIQVFDDLSDQSKFSGFDDGNRVKTINITTKKDKSVGYFGRVVGGVGTDGTYDESLNVHRFNGNQQISLVGQLNDINKQNFTPADLGQGGGGGRRGGGSSSGSNNGGITTTGAIGLNYRDTWGKNTDAYGSYFYNDMKTDVKTSSHVQNILTADTTTLNDQNQESLSRSRNHRINFNIESKLDSMNSIVFRPGISITNSNPWGTSSSLNTYSDGTKIYGSNGYTRSTNSGFAITNANVQLRHKFKKAYRTISLDMNVNANVNNGDGYNYAVNNFYSQNKVDTINQHYFDTSHSFTIAPTVSYTEPLAKNQILEFRYAYSYLNSRSTNNTYQFDDVKGGYASFDSLFSNDFKNTTSSNRVSVTYRLQNAKYNFNIGSGVQFTELTSINSTKNTRFSNNYVNFTPNAQFTYNFSKNKNLRIFYQGATGQPSVTQLQPIRTTTDSINFQVGNPDLKPQFTHSLRMLYHAFNMSNQQSFFATLNASAVTNDIQSSVIQNTATGEKTSTYVNLNGTYNVNGYVNWTLPLKKPKSNLNLGAIVNYSQAQSLINLQSNYARNTTLTQIIKWTTNLDNYFDMNFSANTTYQIAKNSLRANSNANTFSETFSTEITYYSKNGWIVASNFDYTYFGNHSPGYNASVPLWNPAIAKQFLKNKAAELRLQVYDMLNQNALVTRTNSINVITDTRTNVLKRYFMLTFTYNLRNFAKGNDQGRRMPGFFRGDRGDGNDGGGGRWNGGGGGGGGRRGGGGSPMM